MRYRKFDTEILEDMAKRKQGTECLEKVLSDITDILDGEPSWMPRESKKAAALAKKLLTKALEGLYKEDVL